MERAVDPARDGGTTLRRCPSCRDKVVVERASEIVVHNAIVRVDRATGRITAKCRRCKSWVEVPLRYTE